MQRNKRCVQMHNSPKRALSCTSLPHEIRGNAGAVGADRDRSDANGQSEQNKTENGINQAQDNSVSWYGLEVFPAEAQRFAQVGKADFANDKGGGDAEDL
jgi:hypothetical protein